MSRPEFTALPDPKPGQIWRTLIGSLYTVPADGLAFPFALKELVQDEHGFTIWRGGPCPVPDSAIVTTRFADGSSGTRQAVMYNWNDSALIAYKLAGPASAATSIISAKEKVAIDRSFNRFSSARLAIAPGADSDDRRIVSIEIPAGYGKLFAVLMQAFEQASGGKGKERHAKEGVPFEEQPMSAINKQLGSIDGFIYQAHKKSLEAKRLPDGRAQAELLGAVNYLAGAVIALDTWAEKDLPVS